MNKKRNLIFLVIDSLSYSTLKKYPFKNELFINNFIKKHSRNYENVYTQGPYTEASMNGLAYGQQALDYGSFMYSHSRCNHSFVDIIHKDYTTFCSGMSCRLFVDHSKKSFDKFHYHFYTPTTLPTLQWNRINHFCALNKKRNLSTLETQCLKNLIEYALKDTITFIENFLTKKYETSLSNSLISIEDVRNLLSKTKKELNSFHKSESAFIKKVLSSEIDFSKFDFKYNVEYENPKKIKEIFDLYRPLLTKQMEKNILFSADVFRLYINNLKNMSISKNNNFCIEFLKYITSAKRKRNSIKTTYDKLLIPNNNVKRAVSFNACLSQIEDFLLTNKNNEKPFFVYCQPDDYHPPATFWSYDSSDQYLIKAELEDALKLAKRFKKIQANIFDYLSLNYIDKKIESLFVFLKNNGLLETTDVVLTADHGSWFFNNATRPDESLIMTEERMHIPCMFFRLGQKPSVDNSLHCSYSIPNSILKFMNYDEDEYFYGKSFDIDENEFLLSENLGFGCPDIFNVPINYVVHNKKYKLNIKVSFNEHLGLKNCVGFYDLENDPLEQINQIKKAKKKYKNILKLMLSFAEERHSAVCSKVTEENFYLI